MGKGNFLMRQASGLSRHPGIPKVLALALTLLALTSGGLAAQAVTGSSSAAGTVTVTVAAAANLATVADDLKSAFRQEHPGVKLEFVFGASGTLVTQIQNGAPYDLFMSADVDSPAKLATAGLGRGQPVVYASGKLILFSTTPRDFRCGLAILNDPAVTQFALANPELAPYGKAAQEALSHAGLWEKVKDKVVTAQTITQALQYTRSATGLGFVNKSALYTVELAASRDQEGKLWMEVPSVLHAPINQACLVLTAAADKPEVLAFARFLASDAARAVFQSHGYAVPAK
jgi:molybdate transport system substrate-binding protein